MDYEGMGRDKGGVGVGISCGIRLGNVGYSRVGLGRIEYCWGWLIRLGPNIYWTTNYGTGIVFIGNMLSWLSFHNFV